MHWNPLRTAVEKKQSCERSLLKLWEYLRHRRICKAQTVTLTEAVGPRLTGLTWAAFTLQNLHCSSQIFLVRLCAAIVYILRLLLDYCVNQPFCRKGFACLWQYVFQYASYLCNHLFKLRMDAVLVHICFRILLCRTASN